MAGLGPFHLAGLAAAAGLVAAAFWLFWAARARADDDRRIELPVLGKVGNPTALTLALCCVIAAYHAAAYALIPVVALTSVPVERWWIVAVVIAVAVVGALSADALESRP